MFTRARSPSHFALNCFSWSRSSAISFVELFYFGLVVLALYGLSLYLELLEAARYLVELLWDGVALHAELGGSLVHKVDCLVGEEAVGDVTLGEFHCGNARIVLYSHLVVVLVAFLPVRAEC